MNVRTLVYMLALLVGLAALTPAPVRAAEAPEGRFVAEEHPEIVEALGDHEHAAGVLDALADAGTNWAELWEAIDSLEGVLWSHACWLVINMPHLDRLEMTRECLLQHVRFAYATRTQLPYAAPQELFREYILTYRIGDEPVKPWRAEMWFNFAHLVGDTTAETARNINEWVAANLTPRDRGFFGSRPDPMAVITAGTGTESDIASVAIALCKTFGVPARRARVSVLGEEEGGRTWLEIYSDGEWLPLYPDAPEAFGDTGLIEREHPHNITVVSALAAFTNVQVTDRYSDSGSVRLRFTRNGEPVGDFEHFTISAWNNGAWMPLDDLGFDLEEERMTAEGEEGFLAVLGDGSYVVQVGVRNARGDAYVQTVPVTLDPGDEVELTFALDIPASESETVDLIQRTLDPLPEIDLNYTSEPWIDSFMFPDYLSHDEYTCLVVFDAGQEPSVRMVQRIAEWAAGDGVSVIGAGVGDIDAAERLWEETGIEVGPRARFFPDPEGTIAEAFGHSPNDEGLYIRLPFVLLLTADREVIYLQEGYNLSVAEGLARAMQLAELE